MEEQTCTTDGLTIWHQSTDFMRELELVESHRAGMDSGYKIYRVPVSRDDLQVEWRVDVIFLVNLPATKLSRDFVECGRRQRNLALYLPVR